MSLLTSITLILIASISAFSSEVDYKIHGKSWGDFGRIMNVSDTLINGGSVGSNSDNALNLEGNGLHTIGAQINVIADLTPNIEGAFGFGAHKVNHAVGQGAQSYFSITMFQSFLTESRMTYYIGEKEAPVFSLTAGTFQHKYNQHSHNLGLYLLRGPVYPAILMGGYQDFYNDPSKAPFMGTRIHSTLGNFSHSLILNNERDLPPTFDWSLAYLAKYKLGGFFEIGTGVNFYRGVGVDFIDKYMVYNEDLLEPGHLPNAQLSFKKDNYIEVDTTFDGAGEPISFDTLYFTHQGIKLMGHFSLDFKPLIGISHGNDNDMILYGETAVIGVKNYGKTYDEISERIPVMIGLNLPTFGLLDLLSIEVEWFGSKYRNDLARVGNNNVVADWTTQIKPIPSPKPVDYSDYGISEDGIWINANGDDTVNVFGTEMDVENLTKDNIKWSLKIEKAVANHIVFSGLIASDHYRPKPVATDLINSQGGTATAFSSPSDWYFLLRTSFFF